MAEEKVSRRKYMTYAGAGVVVVAAAAGGYYYTTRAPTTPTSTIDEELKPFLEANIDWQQFKGEEIVVSLRSHPWQRAIQPYFPIFEKLTGIKINLIKQNITFVLKILMIKQERNYIISLLMQVVKY